MMTAPNVVQDRIRELRQVPAPSVPLGATPPPPQHLAATALTVKLAI